MNITILNGDYFGFNKIDLDFLCEIHFTRFGNTNIPLHTKYKNLNPKTEKINFNDQDSFKVFVSSTEPTSSRNKETISNIIQNAFQYDLVLTSDEEVLHNCDNAIFFPYGGTWLNKKIGSHLDSLGVFDESLIIVDKKEYNISFLSTSHTGLSGYDLRKIIWNNRDKIEINTKFYSSTRFRTDNYSFSNTLHDGPLPNDDKINLFNSMFSICVESTSEKNYFTEKLIDCLLTKTVPIYFGCPNIQDFFDIRGFITFNSYEEFLEKINNINEKTYEEMKKYVDINYEKAKEYGKDLLERIIKEVSKYKSFRENKKDILWTIGILTIPEREKQLNQLCYHLSEITPYCYSHRIEILVNGESYSVGTKRNKIIEKARGKYISFIDDDDDVSDQYIHKIVMKLDKQIYDAIGFYGLYYVNRQPILIFNHANKNKESIKINDIQYRTLNHLNPVLTEYSKQIKFPEINYAEDSDYSDRLYQSNLIKNEFVFEEVMYHYLWSPTETRTQQCKVQ